MEDETSLQKGSKYSHSHELAQNQEIEILVRPDILPEGPLKALLSKARITMFQLSVGSWGLLTRRH